MTFFKQLGLLLRHKILLRRRRLTILGLEIFWPGIVFLSVLLFRLKFPPESKPSCHYNSKALPSAGAVNFIQSLVCTIDNLCLNESSYKEVPDFPKARIHKLVNNISPLLKDEKVIKVIQELPKGIRLLSMIVNTLYHTEVRSFLEDGWPIKDILSDSGRDQIQLFLLKALSATKGQLLASESVKTLVNSNINVVRLSQFSQKSSLLRINEIICNPSLLTNILTVESDQQLSLLSESLCSLSRSQMQSFFQLTQDSLDFAKIIDKFSAVFKSVGLDEIRDHFDNIGSMIKEIDRTQIFTSVNSLLNATTWTDNVPHLIQISTQFENLYNVGYQLNSRRGGPIVTLINLTKNETFTMLIEEISEIIVKLTPKLKDEPILDTFNIILRGLESLKYISNRGLFTIKYQFSDLLDDVSIVKMFMEYRLGIDSETIDTILNSTIDFTDFVAQENIDPNLLCNKTQLLYVLEMPKYKTISEDLMPVDLTCHALCTLSIVGNFRFTNEILRQFAVRKIIDNLVTIITDSLLAKFNFNKLDIPEALEGLKSTAKAMPNIKEFFKTFIKDLDLQDELSELNARKERFDSHGTSQAAAIFGKSLCGYPIPMLSNEFKHWKSTSFEATADEDELKNSRNEFCKNGYRQVLKLAGGPVIWAWLKPILAGKILYTPDNHLTRAIMSRMNGTFNLMSLSVHLLESWTGALDSLETFYSKTNASERVKNAQNLIPTLFGKDSEHLFDDLEAFKLPERLENSRGLLGLIKFVSNIAQCFEMGRFFGFKDEVSMEATARSLTKSHELLAGVVFLNVDNQKTLPTSVEYKIRADIDFVPTTKMLKDRIWEPGSKDHYANDLGYLRGFVQVQEMIDRAITSIHLNQTSLIYSPSVHLQQFPYACYKKDKFGFLILALTPVINTLAWIFLIAFLIREFVFERELHLEDYLRVTGLKSSVAWVAWFIIGFSVMTFGSICGLTIFKFAKLIYNSDIIILYSYLICFTFSIIMFCYLMSTFFKTATIASLSGIIVYLVSYLPFMVVITLEHEMSFLQKLLSCFSMSTSFSFGIMYLARYEAQGIGIQWSNIWQSPMPEDQMNFALSEIMMLVDGFIYFLLAWYISNVFPPGNEGPSEPWYFFLLPRYWGFQKKVKVGETKLQNLRAHIQSNGRNGKYSLENGWKRRPGILLQNLYVIYNKGFLKSEHRAVSNFSLELGEGQITTLLGRNGAGKTTTIRVLTGQLQPTSGSVYIYGHPVPEEFSNARKLLGYCPQYNVLFGDLTVREHLRFFSDLKSLLPSDQIEEDVDTMLHSTNLWHLQHELARNLSGGLQRRLCVALAFVGGSKLIILDEPTSSVDPVARRSIWDLIVRQKQSRTVLLTTHHMDEADILSDQVAVIHRGKLLCHGSPLLLRSKYGCGYQLTVSRQSIITEEKETNDSDSGRASNEPSDSEQSDSERLLAFTKCLIPNAALIDDYNNSDVILALPHYGPDGYPHDYATFFRCLDANINALGFRSYGLTSTTLEEVFLTLCSLEESNIPLMESTKIAVLRMLNNPLLDSSTDHDLIEQDRLQYDPKYSTYPFSSISLVSGVTLKFMQLFALLRKRALHAFQDWKSLFCSLFLPCVFIALAMGMTCIKPYFGPDPILPMKPAIYGPATVSFFHSTHTNNEVFNSMINSLINEKSAELNCQDPSNGWKLAKCPIMKPAEPNFPPFFTTTLESKDEVCACQKTCSKPPKILYDSIKTKYLTSDGYLYDISSQESVNNFLLNTFQIYNDHRYGGYTFHHLTNNSNHNEHHVKVWFDNNGYHAITSYLSAINNAVMKSNLEKAGLNSSQYSIRTYSHPFHMRSSQVGDQTKMQKAADAGIALIILVGYVFIPTSFVFYLVRERTQEEKQLQRIFGIGTFLYWFAAVIWDMISVIIAVALSGIILYLFQIPIYTARLNLPAVLVLLLLFGWAMTSLVYLMEKMFNESSIAFMVIYCLSLFIGINTMVMRLLIDIFKLVEVSEAFKETFQSVALIFPPYALMSGLVDITKNQLFAEIFTLFHQDTYINPFSMDMLGPYYLSLASEGAILFLINLIVEYIINSSVTCAEKGPINVSSYVHEDFDVAEERRRVAQSDSSLFNILSVIDLSKIFKSMFGKRVAVNNISFGVLRGECFGLLGVNGAGKTTLFKILTGQMKPTYGGAAINKKVSSNASIPNQTPLVGYCPQADALDNVLTPKQHLSIYATMRGIPAFHRPRIIDDSLNKFQLSQYSEMPVNALSRGTKRKLCLAISMLGDPSIVLLDEPTSGMDPMSRRCLWHNIQTAIKERRSVLLTSHSMEECDILCSRLAIMVNGCFRCIGSPQYLKHKFGSGYTITLRLNGTQSNWNEAIGYMKQWFPNIILRAHHHTMLEFSLPTKDVKLSNIFNSLQNAQKYLDLNSYSVSQTTLDQVFVSFANQQDNDVLNVG